MGHPLWSLYDLHIRTERLVMRLPNEDEIAQLVTKADGSLYADPSSVPFVIDWPNRPSPARERGFAQFHWKLRADWTPESWHLLLVAFLDGQPVGSQGMQADDFARLRTVHTGSYILRDFQGQGFGTEMRQAVMELAFAGLDAHEAHSSARTDNHASRGVSRKLGYVDNGVSTFMFGDQRGEDHRLLLRRKAWQANRVDGITIEGLEANLDMFGVGESVPPGE